MIDIRNSTRRYIYNYRRVSDVIHSSWFLAIRERRGLHPRLFENLPSLIYFLNVVHSGLWATFSGGGYTPVCSSNFLDLLWCWDDFTLSYTKFSRHRPIQTDSFRNILDIFFAFCFARCLHVRHIYRALLMLRAIWTYLEKMPKHILHNRGLQISHKIFLSASQYFFLLFIHWFIHVNLALHDSRLFSLLPLVTQWIRIFYRTVNQYSLFNPIVSQLEFKFQELDLFPLILCQSQSVKWPLNNLLL